LARLARAAVRRNRVMIILIIALWFLANAALFGWGVFLD
jgi:hypothetical protein